MTVNPALATRRKPRSVKWDAELIEIIDESPDVKTFRFEKPKNWSFTPGQYLMVRFPEIFGKKNRAYSIASSPNSEYIDLTIKLYGLFTHHMFTLKEGSSWSVRGPYGHFTMDTESNDDLVLLGAGVGITPLMCMARYLSELKSDRRMLMIYSNKKPKDIIYHVELQMMERMNPKLKVVYTLTRLQDKLMHSWPGLTGRISSEMIKSEVLEWQQEGKQLSSYSCGPVPMLNTVEKCLLEIGWDKEKIHYEKFW